MDQRVERRLHERIAAGVPVFYEPVDLARPERLYLTGMATCASLGGMFVTTPDPERPGTVLVVRLYLDDADDALPLRAKAIVRWRQRFRHPHGMGIEFLEFERLGGERLAGWLPNAESTAAAAPLPLHLGALPAGSAAAAGAD